MVSVETVFDRGLKEYVFEGNELQAEGKHVQRP